MVYKENGRLVAEDRIIDALGKIFIMNKIRERYGITFEQFVQMKQNGTWESVV